MYEEEVGEDEWVIEEIVSQRKNKGNTEYLIKWIGWDESDNSWHTMEELADMASNFSRELIEEFQVRRKGGRKAKKKGEVTKEQTIYDRAQKKLDDEFKEKMEAHERKEEEMLQERERKLAEVNEKLQEIRRLKAIEEQKEAEEIKRQKLERFDRLRYKYISQVHSPLEKAVEIPPRPEPPVYKEPPSRVRTLRAMCIACISNSLELYEGFEEVPVIWKANMFSYLSKTCNLTAEKFRILLDPNQTRLDLSLSRTSMTPLHFFHLQRCESLKEFIIRDCLTINDGDLGFVEFCPHLEVLNLRGCKNIRELPNFHNARFKKLDISYTGINMKVLASTWEKRAIDLLSYLEELHFKGALNHFIDFTLYVLKTCRNLRILNLDKPLTLARQRDTMIYLSEWVNKWESIEVMKLGEGGYRQFTNKLFEFRFFGKLKVLKYETEGSCYEIMQLLKVSCPKLEHYQVKTSDSPQRIAFSQFVTPEDDPQKNQRVFEVPKNLHSIHLHERVSLGFSLSVIDTILEQNSNPLKSLALQSWSTQSLTVAHVIQVFKTQTHPFESLNVSGWGNNPGTFLVELPITAEEVRWDDLQLNCNTNLTRLTMDNLEWLTVDIFIKLVRYDTCPNLKKLSVRGGACYKAAFYEHILTEFPSLEKLTLGDFGHRDTFSHLRKFPDVNTFKSVNKLKSLKLLDMTKLSIPLLKGLLETFPKITSLTIQTKEITKEFFDCFLASRRRIQVLELISVKLISVPEFVNFLHCLKSHLIVFFRDFSIGMAKALHNAEYLDLKQGKRIRLADWVPQTPSYTVIFHGDQTGVNKMWVN